MAKKKYVCPIVIALAFNTDVITASNGVGGLDSDDKDNKTLGGFDL